MVLRSGVADTQTALVLAMELHRFFLLMRKKHCPPFSNPDCECLPSLVGVDNDNGGNAEPGAGEVDTDNGRTCGDGVDEVEDGVAVVGVAVAEPFAVTVPVLFGVANDNGVALVDARGDDNAIIPCSLDALPRGDDIAAPVAIVTASVGAIAASDDDDDDVSVGDDAAVV